MSEHLHIHRPLAAAPKNATVQASKSFPPTAAVLQRRALHEKIHQKKEADRAEQLGRAKAAREAETNAGGLPQNIQAKMEGAFGADFSSVSIHQNSSQATELGALAYTQGEDIHFAPGQFDTSSLQGQSLIGHELAHVVQQRAGRVQATTQLKGTSAGLGAGVGVNDDVALEREADVMGEKAARGEVSSANRIHSKELGATSVAQRKTSGQQQPKNDFFEVGKLKIKYEDSEGKILRTALGSLSFGALPTFPLTANSQGTIEVTWGEFGEGQGIAIWRFLVTRTGGIYISSVNVSKLPSNQDALLKTVGVEQTQVLQNVENDMINLRLLVEGPAITSLSQATYGESKSTTTGTSSSSTIGETVKVENTTSASGGIKLIEVGSETTLGSETNFQNTNESHNDQQKGSQWDITKSKSVTGAISKGIFGFSAKFRAVGAEAVYDRGKCVYFEKSGQKSLSLAETEELSKTIALKLHDEQYQLLNIGAAQLIFVGFADPKGEALKNQELSFQRADAVRNTFLKQNPDIKASSTIARGKGEFTSVLPDGMDDPASRRVEIIYAEKKK